jgi:hypothetical protein
MFTQEKVFLAPSIVQEHKKKKNPRDELLMVDVANSSSLQSMNS